MFLADFGSSMLTSAVNIASSTNRNASSVTVHSIASNSIVQRVEESSPRAPATTRFPNSKSRMPVLPMASYTQSSMPTKTPIRVLVAKPGLDGHDRGAKIIARALRDAGMEVIYTGLRQTPEMIVSAAIQEDVDCIGLSILSGAHNVIVPRIIALLREKRAENILLVLGGTIPEEDIPALKQNGVSAIFGPGTPLETTITFIRSSVKQTA